MKKTKETKNGVKTITLESNEKFINFASAILAGQAMQFVTGTQGYLSNLSVSQERGRVELSIHFSDSFPIIPSNYKYTGKEITSHQYWSDISKSVCKVRVISYYFKY